MEHIQSKNLIQRLDEFLGFPQYDPHGDPIPSEEGLINEKKQVALSDLGVNATGIVRGLKETSPLFLQYLDKIQIYIGVKLKIVDKIEFDASLEIQIDGRKSAIISNEVAKNILVTE